MNMEKFTEFIENQEFIKNNKKLYDISNFKNSDFGSGFFYFTARVMSTEMLEFLTSSDKIEKALFHPSSPPHGGFAADSISQRYGVHIRIKEVK